jgi:hypothetical protein
MTVWYITMWSEVYDDGIERYSILDEGGRIHYLSAVDIAKAEATGVIFKAYTSVK